MKNDREVYFQSERTGYSHLYAVPFDGGEPRALTSGQLGSHQRHPSRDKTRFFLVTSEADPGEHNLYEMRAEGGPLTRLTSLPGGHSCTLSPDDRWFADIYSYTNKPPELYVQESRAGVTAKKLTSSPAPDFWQYPWQDTPIVQITARDGAMVPRPPLQARQLPARRPGGNLRARRRLSAERPSRVDLQLLARVHVPPPAARARLPRDRRRLPRLGRLRPRLAHRHLSAHGRQGSRRQRRRRPLAGLASKASTPSESASTAAATAASSP